LNAGKQGVFAGFMGSVEKNKAKANKELEAVREDIKVYSFLIDLVVILLGHFEIQRFRDHKLRLYFQTIKKIAAFQIEFTNLRSSICQHVL
jgi:hypothetical protein